MKKNILPRAEKLVGEIVLPGDKSISHRAIMLGAISNGRTMITGLLDCDDCNHTIMAFREMGLVIEGDSGLTVVNGLGLRGLKKPAKPLYMGSSGTTMRVLSGILAGQNFEVILEADRSLAARPMDRVIKPLSAMGVEIESAPQSRPPIKIKGGNVRPIKYTLPVPSAQVKSAILLAGLYSEGLTVVEENYKSRDHTERMLAYFGSDIKVEGLKISLRGGRELASKALAIPKDISSASFFMVGAAILKNSRVEMRGVSVNPTRAGVIDIMRRMGARIEIVNAKDNFEPVGDIIVESSSTKGIVIDKDVIPSIIDELPIIFVLAALSKGSTVIKGAGELKVKETDRIASMKWNLDRMGAKIRLEGDDVVIDGVETLRPAELRSFNDHRTCMSMTIASLAANGQSVIDDVSCVAKSLPDFFKMLNMVTN